jgi:dynein heavy chain
METNSGSGKIPWDDLKYIFGEIMYGGHIVDDWDRRFCATYLDVLMNDALLDEAEMFPFIEGKNISFKAPTPLTHEKYIEYIVTELPPETPIAYGMHPNAEIDFRTNQCNNLFYQLVDLQPKNTTGGGDSIEDTKIKDYFDLVNNGLALDGSKINMDDLNNKLSDENNPLRPY